MCLHLNRPLASFLAIKWPVRQLAEILSANRSDQGVQRYLDIFIYSDNRGGGGEKPHINVTNSSDDRTLSLDGDWQQTRICCQLMLGVAFFIPIRVQNTRPHTEVVHWHPNKTQWHTIASDTKPFYLLKKYSVFCVSWPLQQTHY